MMFRNEHQKGIISIFLGSGSSPLKIWNIKSENGRVERVFNEELKSLVLEITGCNVSTTYITCPKNKDEGLGISMPIFNINWKNIYEFFAFEIMIKDDKNLRRRLHFSNFLNIPSKKSTFYAVVPIKALPEGWKMLKIDLSNCTKAAFGSCYVETTRVQINANCLLKGIFFSDIVYDEIEIPNDCKLLKKIQPRKIYIPFQKKRKASKSKIPVSVDSSDVVPWTHKMGNVEESKYDTPHPSPITSDNDESETTFTIRNDELANKTEDEDEDEEYELGEMKETFVKSNMENGMMESNSLENNENIEGEEFFE